MRTVLSSFILLALLLQSSEALSQATEAYGAHQRSGVDIMWFKRFKKKNEAPGPFLFFSRNRASVAYERSVSLFASTNAVSYNLKNGWGMVLAGTFLMNGVSVKSGIQYFKQEGAFMFFGWCVSELKSHGSIDLFMLFRFQPSISPTLKLFSQVEVFPVYQSGTRSWNLTQRLRLGLKHRSWAAGPMADFNQVGAKTWKRSNNLGAFVRYEF
ncbi:MAG: hypothetical protein MUF42_06150 [Cytophagaceae bacterium]|jgi:hypothetical protein|nr:hypothetical protein [Cytophagaceae bacterium]